MITNEGILYIEPKGNAAIAPIIDELTCRMTAALRLGIPGVRYKGFHICACGATSDNTDYTLPNGEKTNSLCIHYLAFHRAEIPESQFKKVAALECGEEIPTEREISIALVRI